MIKESETILENFKQEDSRDQELFGYCSLLPTPRMAFFILSDGLLTTLERVGVLNPPLASAQSESEQDDNEGDDGTPKVEAFLGVAKNTTLNQT